MTITVTMTGLLTQSTSMLNRNVSATRFASSLQSHPSSLLESIQRSTLRMAMAAFSWPPQSSACCRSEPSVRRHT